MKSGFVAILGRPNVGKSTLLNAMINRHISIITDKPQTTRNQIKGIYHSKDAQIIFTDTPGIHKPHAKLGEEMNNMAYSAAHDVEVALLVIDASLPFGDGDQYLIDHLDIKNVPLIIIFNKIDKTRLDKALKLKEKYLSIFPNATIIETVATTRFNVDEIIKKVIELLPEGPAYYPDDVISDKDEVFFIKEIIREKVLKILKEEVPHSIAIYIDNIDYEADPLHIIASIIVEKDSQKGIVIGKGGKRIKLIGSRSREDIEALLHKHVYLELFVKVINDWRNSSSSLIDFGYKKDK